MPDNLYYIQKVVISDDARLTTSVWRLSVCRVHRA